MARRPRIVVPGYPLHVVQRGNNRQACFFCEHDYRFYLDHLAEAAPRYGCRLHAYVLMTNHVHLLLTPDSATAVSRLLQAVGRRYVRYVNRLYRRSGTLWEGRFKSSVIDSQRYLFVCSRYIELNPVRAGMADDPGGYRWSSYRRNGQGAPDPVVSPHSLYLALGETDERRCEAYRCLFDEDGHRMQFDGVRDATERGVVLGNDRFREELEVALGRRVEKYRHGGDRKSNAFRSKTLTP